MAFFSRKSQPEPSVSLEDSWQPFEAVGFEDLPQDEASYYADLTSDASDHFGVYVSGGRIVHLESSRRPFDLATMAFWQYQDEATQKRVMALEEATPLATLERIAAQAPDLFGNIYEKAMAAAIEDLTSTLERASSWRRGEFQAVDIPQAVAELSGLSPSEILEETARQTSQRLEFYESFHSSHGDFFELILGKGELDFIPETNPERACREAIGAETTIGDLYKATVGLPWLKLLSCLRQLLAGGFGSIRRGLQTLPISSPVEKFEPEIEEHLLAKARSKKSKQRPHELSLPEISEEPDFRGNATSSDADPLAFMSDFSQKTESLPDFAGPVSSIRPEIQEEQLLEETDTADPSLVEDQLELKAPAHVMDLAEALDPQVALAFDLEDSPGAELSAAAREQDGLQKSISELQESYAEGDPLPLPIFHQLLEVLKRRSELLSRIYDDSMVANSLEADDLRFYVARKLRGMAAALEGALLIEAEVLAREEARRKEIEEKAAREQLAAEAAAEAVSSSTTAPAEEKLDELEEPVDESEELDGEELTDEVSSEEQLPDLTVDGVEQPTEGESAEELVDPDAETEVLELPAAEESSEAVADGAADGLSEVALDESEPDEFEEPIDGGELESADSADETAAEPVRDEDPIGDGSKNPIESYGIGSASEPPLDLNLSPIFDRLARKWGLDS